MRVLFFNGFNVSPHLETEMELAKDLMNEGAEIFFVHCRGELDICFANVGHTKWICANCRDRKLVALKMLGVPADHIIPFPKDITKVVDESIIPPIFRDIDELKAFIYKGTDIGMGVASSLVSQARDHRLDTEKHKDWIGKGIRTSISVYDYASELLDRIKPDKVVLFNGRFLEIRPVMRVCEQRGIQYLTHERGGGLDTYLIRENSTPHSLKATAEEINSLWGDGGSEKEKLGRQFFTDRRNKVMQAWVVFTENQEAGRLPASFDKSKRNITFFNSSMDEYEGIAGFTSKIYRDDNAGIRAILQHFQPDASVHFYLRVHPNLKGQDNTQMKELAQIAADFPNLTVIAPGDVIDSYALMEASDTVCVFSSTMGSEAVFWGQPVVLLGNAFYRGLEGFYKPASHEEAIALLNRKLEPLSGEDVLKYGYWELSKGHKYKYYTASGLGEGRFLGRKVDVGRIRKAINYLFN